MVERKAVRMDMKSVSRMSCLLLLITLLTGCMYSNTNRGPQASPQESVAIVQAAVDRYVAEKNILPIKNFDSDTPLYERYVIDFRKLMGEGFISQLPQAAYEQGGSFYFVIVDAEKQPTVKMLDIAMIQQVGDVIQAVHQYRGSHSGELPLADEISQHWHHIDYSALKMKPVELSSPFSTLKLTLMIHQDGQVAINYAPDIMRMVDQFQISNPEQVEDLRVYLVQYSDFVPAVSVPYSWQEDRPVAKP